MKTENEMKELIGKRVIKIFMNEHYLLFETDKGGGCYEVDGECCSQSVFYDFIGVKKLLGRVVKDIEDVALDIDEDADTKQYQEKIQSYGYRIITEHPEFGEQSSVFSFRNYSNGYYGGEILKRVILKVQPEITDDVLETAMMSNSRSGLWD